MKLKFILPPIVTLTAAASFAGTVPFHSESNGTFAFLSDPSLPVFQVGIDHPVVNATPFDFQTFQGEQTVNLIAPPPIVGSFTLTMGGGDTLLGSYVSDLTFLGTGEAVADGTFSFQGGTGLFKGASGGGTMFASIDLANGTSGIRMDGSLTVPDAGSTLSLTSLGLFGLALTRRRGSV